MNIWRYSILLICLGLVFAGTGFAQDDEPDVVRITARWIGAEAEGFQAVLDQFTTETGIEVIYESDPMLVENVVKTGFLDNPADIAFLGRPGVIRRLVADTRILPLDDPVDPIVEHGLLNETLNPEFIRLGKFQGRQYGVMVTSRSKSTIWYKPASFESLGLDIPETWDELAAVVDTLVAEGRTPFALGGGDGWTLSDWFENIFVRLYGDAAYDQLFLTRGIGWDDARVANALAMMSDMLLPVEERLAKGEASVLDVGYRDSIGSWLSGDAELYFEGGFVRTTAQEDFPDLVCGEDYSFFMFPSIEPDFGTPMVGSGELAVVFNDNQAVRQFMNFIASPEAATTWVTAESGAIISPNLQMPIDVYVDACSAMEAEQIRETTLFVFDGSDLLPGILGEYAFFTALQDYLIDPGAITEILDYLAFSVIKSY